MNTFEKIATPIKNESIDSSLKNERWVDVWTKHDWLVKKFPKLIDAMTIVEAETPKAVLLRNGFAKKSTPSIQKDMCGHEVIQRAWVAKSLIEMREI